MSEAPARICSNRAWVIETFTIPDVGARGVLRDCAAKWAPTNEREYAEMVALPGIGAIDRSGGTVRGCRPLRHALQRWPWVRYAATVGPRKMAAASSHRASALRR